MTSATDQRTHRHRVEAPRRHRWAVVAVLGPMVAAALAVIALTWPSGVAQVSADAGLAEFDAQFARATVVGASTQRCDGTIEDVQVDGTIPDTVACVLLRAELTSGPDRGQQVEVIAPPLVREDRLAPGTSVVLVRYPTEDGGTGAWVWSDFARGVPLAVLTAAFVVAAALVAGWRGLRAVAGLVIAALVLWVYLLPALLTGAPAVLAGLAASVVIMTAVVYLAHGVSMRSTTALLGTFAGLGLVLGIGAVAARASQLAYVASEEDYRLASMLGDSGVATLRGVFLCGVLLAGLGVLNDVTITQASAVWELRSADPGAGWRELFTGGMRIGRDHIASTIYTIVFAYAGASLPVLLLLQVYQLPVMQTLTGASFAEEIVRTLAGSIGLILTIPFTTAIAATVALSGPPSAGGGGHGHGH